MCPPPLTESNGIGAILGPPQIGRGTQHSSLTTGARVKRFSPTPFPGRLRFCRSAISLSQEGCCVFDQSPVFSQSGGGRKVSPLISSATTATIAASNSPLFGEAGGLLKRSADASATG